jgi:hypothetical protein
MLAAQFSPQFAVVCAPPPRLATGIILYVTTADAMGNFAHSLHFSLDEVFFLLITEFFFNKFCVINKKL